VPARRVGAHLGAAAILLAAAAMGTAPAAVAQDFSPGAEGIGDPYFPQSGNGGYDVSRYQLDLDLTSRRGSKLAAVATISATATQGLSSFDLDFRGPKISQLTVEGQAAALARHGQELIVTPPSPIAAGQQFEVAVAYAGQVGPLRTPDGSRTGWFPTGDGAFVANEPHGAPTWFPCNDHPTDKATYDFRITVPHGVKAFANGVLVDQVKKAGGATTFVWHEDRPMATYLATATSGRFRLEQSTVAGLPSYTGVDPREARASRKVLARLPAILSLFDSTFGPYPFSSTGAIVDRAPFVGYALETQTRPLFDRAPDDVLLAHELAHQWFGDSVTPSSWSDVWLNEGFATWAQWLWKASRGGDTLERTFEHFYEVPAKDRGFWRPAPGDPGGPKHLFDPTVYVRGAMTLEALREKLGDATFGALLRQWAADHQYGNASIADFIALAEQQSGQQLDDFFRIWLYEPAKPQGW
jgi:aminopeptidase N